MDFRGNKIKNKKINKKNSHLWFFPWAETLSKVPQIALQCVLLSSFRSPSWRDSKGPTVRPQLAGSLPPGHCDPQHCRAAPLPLPRLPRGAPQPHSVRAEPAGTIGFHFSGSYYLLLPGSCYPSRLPGIQEISQRSDSSSLRATLSHYKMYIIIISNAVFYLIYMHLIV